MKIPTSIYKFLVSGGIATCIDFVCYMLLRQFTWPSVAKTISMLIANVWVFVSERQTDARMVGLYVIVQALNLGTNVSVNSLMLYFTGYVILSFVIATLCATIVNYSLQKLIVFK